MSGKVVVFGASGNLGMAVAMILKKEYEVVAFSLTENNSNESTLASAGIQVHHESMDEMDTVTTLMEGARAAFVVTHTEFTCADAHQRELQTGQRISDACAKVGLEHVVLVTARSVVKATGFRVRHMDAKAEIADYMTSRGLPLTCLIVPIFYDFLIEVPLRPMKRDQCSYELEIPMGQVPLDMIGLHDAAHVVHHVIKTGRPLVGKTLALAGDKLTVAEIAAVLTVHMHPMTFKDKQVTVDQFRKKNFPGCDDVATMFQFFSRVDQRVSIDATRNLYPTTQSFEQWLLANKNHVAQALDYPITST